MSTIPQAVDRAAREFGAAEALVDGATRLSFVELRDQVRRMARFLRARGIERGDRVAVWAPNTHHWVIAALGTHYAGATLVPVNTRYTAHEALDILQRTRASALVVIGTFLGQDRLAALREAAPAQGMPHLHTIVRVTTDDTARPDGVVDWDDIASLADGVRDVDPDVVAPDDVSDILFTSGTTGRSKGVLSAHRQVIAVATAWAACGEVGPDDRYLVVNPFFHSFGYKAGIVVCLLTGATIVPMATFTVDAALRIVQDERITVLPGAPTIYQMMLDDPAYSAHDVSSLRFAVTGAAVVPVALVERMQRELGFDIVLTAFGMTEAVVVSMARRDDPADVIARTCGRATADFEIRAGHRGEILLRGPNVMLGYLDDPAATAEAVDEDGWLHTGDVGTVDANGYLTITDRLKDMYICGGFNVYPAEVEQELARLDGVAESAVVGIPDHRLGEVGAAIVVRAAGSSIDADAVIAFCRERLANFKVPRRVEFRDTLPRNPSGKIRKVQLRAELEKATP